MEGQKLNAPVIHGTRKALLGTPEATSDRWYYRRNAGREGGKRRSFKKSVRETERDGGCVYTKE